MYNVQVLFAWYSVGFLSFVGFLSLSLTVRLTKWLKCMVVWFCGSVYRIHVISFFFAFLVNLKVSFEMSQNCIWCFIHQCPFWAVFLSIVDIHSAPTKMIPITKYHKQKWKKNSNGKSIEVRNGICCCSICNL